MERDIVWNPAVVNTDVQFEHAVRAFLRAVRKFKRAPENEERLLELWSELLRAKLLYNNICVEHGSNYKGGREIFYKAVEELDSLLPRRKNATYAVRGISRQVHEIRRVHDSCNMVEGT